MDHADLVGDVRLVGHLEVEHVAVHGRRVRDTVEHRVHGVVVAVGVRDVPQDLVGVDAGLHRHGQGVVVAGQRQGVGEGPAPVEHVRDGYELRVRPDHDHRVVDGAARVLGDQDRLQLDPAANRLEVGARADQGEVHRALGQQLVDLVVGLALDQADGLVQLARQPAREHAVGVEGLFGGQHRRDGEPDVVLVGARLDELVALRDRDVRLPGSEQPGQQHDQAQRRHGEGSPETSCAHADSEPPGTKPTPPRHGTSMEGSRSHPFR